MFTDLFQLEQKPVTVFSSTDTSAPILTTDPGSLKTLLKACLVTGYGSKAALGWEMAFESGDQLQAAFKSTDPTASQFYFKINNSGSSSALLSAYQEMTDIDTGSKAIAVDNDYKLYTSSWRLIGHSKSFVLLLDVVWKSQKTAYPLVFGDLPRQVDRTAPICLLWNGRAIHNIGSVQTALFNRPDGNSAATSSPVPNSAPSYPFTVSNGVSGENLNKNYCKFSFNSQIKSALLHEPVISLLSDSTWTLIPMLQPLSATFAQVNLATVGTIGVIAKTGDYSSATDNVDCIVPTTWWYA